MTFPRLAATFLALSLVVAACGNDERSAAIDLADGFAPSIGDIQTEPSRENVVGLTFVNFDGTTETFDDRLGTPMVVNFFAEWCVTCIQEMPEFQDVSQELLGEVDFLGISIDRGSAEALALVDATGVTYDVGWDPSEELYAHFQGLSMPTTAFVDATGQITRVWSGVLDADSLREKIQEEIL
jgi:thiol-disulfide isomerase/thioredoxin